MPYSGERAGKGGHSAIVNNPDVSQFLQNCSYMKEPSEDEGREISELYIKAPKGNILPKYTVSSDASLYSEPISGKFPSTQIGYVKVSLMLIHMGDFGQLKNSSSRYVDPFKVAELHKNADAFSFVLPGSNVRYESANSVKSGFRKAVFHNYKSDSTRFSKNGRYTLLDTLFELYENNIELKRCPNCGNEHTFQFNNNQQIINCSQCGDDVFATDILRLHEQVGDFTNSASPINRFMNVTEHILVASFIRWLDKEFHNELSGFAFIIDGPLAIFGEPAKVHSKIQKLYYKINKRLESEGKQKFVLLGLQKEGQIMEHARAVNRFINPGSIKVIDDMYRQKYIVQGRELNENFGHETYYGQDFIFKTESGKIFSLAIPYQLEEKGNKDSFSSNKVRYESYGNLIERVCDLVRYFELELYENAIIPVSLAHRHASISIMPGGKVLDLLTRTGINKII